MELRYGALGNPISCVSYNMVEISHNTWWIDSGSTTFQIPYKE